MVKERRHDFDSIVSDIVMQINFNLIHNVYCGRWKEKKWQKKSFNDEFSRLSPMSHCLGMNHCARIALTKTVDLLWKIKTHKTVPTWERSFKAAETFFAFFFSPVHNSKRLYFISHGFYLTTPIISIILGLMRYKLKWMMMCGRWWLSAAAEVECNLRAFWGCC